MITTADSSEELLHGIITVALLILAVFEYLMHTIHNYNRLPFVYFKMMHTILLVYFNNNIMMLYCNKQNEIMTE